MEDGLWDSGVGLLERVDGAKTMSFRRRVSGNGGGGCLLVFFWLFETKDGDHSDTQMPPVFYHNDCPTLRGVTGARQTTTVRPMVRR